MIIDCHAHLVAPDSLYAFRSLLITSGGHFDPPLNVDDGALTKSAANNVALLDHIEPETVHRQLCSRRIRLDLDG
jgi:hypothetical protein